MKTLVLGGVKSGKSQLAVNLAENCARSVSLIATATAHDDEMRRRIEKHRSTRPAAWATLEEPIALGAAIGSMQNTGQCVVVDCLTLWLTNLLMLDDERVFQQEKQDLMEAVESCCETLILVSNETSMGIMPMGELSRRYCDEAGLLHQALAQLSDTVILTVAGLPHLLKGQMS